MCGVIGSTHRVRSASIPLRAIPALDQPSLGSLYRARWRKLLAPLAEAVRKQVIISGNRIVAFGRRGIPTGLMEGQVGGGHHVVPRPTACNEKGRPFCAGGVPMPRKTAAQMRRLSDATCPVATCPGFFLDIYRTRRARKVFGHMVTFAPFWATGETYRTDDPCRAPPPWPCPHTSSVHVNTI